jgi:cytochrome P450
MPVTITSYAEAETLLRRPDLKQALYDEAAILMQKVLVNLHGDEHRARRNVETKVFRRDFFRFYEQTVFPQTLRETLAPFVAQGHADIVDFGYRVMLNLTADFSGIDRPERSPEETASLLKLLRTFGKAATLGQAKGDKAVIRTEIQAGLDEFDRRFYTPSMERRRTLVEGHQAGTVAEEDLPRDVLTVLLQNEGALQADHDVLMKEMAFFLLAGAFTSIHSMTHAMHELFAWREENPRHAERLKDPLFVHRCALESMRLHPSSPTARRRPTAAISLPGGAKLGPEDVIVVDLLSANKDTSVYGSDAASYNPLRPIDKQTAPYGLSFGMGAHACIGRNLAAGVTPRPDTDPKDHHFGTITLIMLALLENNARPNPDDPPRMDTTTTRPNWAYYPILLS